MTRLALRGEKPTTQISPVWPVSYVFVAAVPDDRWPPHLRFPPGRSLEKPEQRLGVLASRVALDTGNEVPDADFGRFGFHLCHVTPPRSGKSIGALPHHSNISNVLLRSI